MKNKILILFAHPRFERSVNNSILVERIPKIPEITFIDLYEKYPDFNIDIENEKNLLLQNQIIIWHHPLYWYSAPPLLKQWIDLVLEFGWAYGPGGIALENKIVFNVVTSGGQQSAYSREGHNRFTLRELLAPFDQTAILCKMVYLPPFALHGTHRIGKEAVIETADNYNRLLLRLVNDDFSVEEIEKYSYLNDWIKGLTFKNQA
jgi:glutathione-regulated potassium-efflux system ancillary protein KefG